MINAYVAKESASFIDQVSHLFQITQSALNYVKGDSGSASSIENQTHFKAFIELKRLKSRLDDHLVKVVD
jgi:hypothetical protein